MVSRVFPAVMQSQVDQDDAAQAPNDDLHESPRTTSSQTSSSICFPETPNIPPLRLPQAAQTYPKYQCMSSPQSLSKSSSPATQLKGRVNGVPASSPRRRPQTLTPLALATVAAEASPYAAASRSLGKLMALLDAGPPAPPLAPASAPPQSSQPRASAAGARTPRSLHSRRLPVGVTHVPRCPTSDAPAMPPPPIAPHDAVTVAAAAVSALFEQRQRAAVAQLRFMRLQRRHQMMQQQQLQAVRPMSQQGNGSAPPVSLPRMMPAQLRRLRQSAIAPPMPTGSPDSSAVSSGGSTEAPAELDGQWMDAAPAYSHADRDEGGANSEGSTEQAAQCSAESDREDDRYDASQVSELATAPAATGCPPEVGSAGSAEECGDVTTPPAEEQAAPEHGPAMPTPHGEAATEGVTTGAAAEGLREAAEEEVWGATGDRREDSGDRGGGEGEAPSLGEGSLPPGSECSEPNAGIDAGDGAAAGSAIGAEAAGPAVFGDAAGGASACASAPSSRKSSHAGPPSPSSPPRIQQPDAHQDSSSEHYMSAELMEERARFAAQLEFFEKELAALRAQLPASADGAAPDNECHALHEAEAQLRANLERACDDAARAAAQCEAATSEARTAREAAAAAEAGMHEWEARAHAAEEARDVLQAESERVQTQLALAEAALAEAVTERERLCMEREEALGRAAEATEMALADADAAEKADEARAAAETAAAAEAERHAVAEAALAAQLSALRRQLDSLRAENVRHADALHALRNDTDAEVERARFDAARAAERAAAAESALAAAEEALAVARQEGDALRRERDEAVAQVADAQQRLSAVQMELAQTRTLASEAAAARDTAVSTAREACAALERAEAAAKAQAAAAAEARYSEATVQAVLPHAHDDARAGALGVSAGALASTNEDGTTAISGGEVTDNATSPAPEGRAATNVGIAGPEDAFNTAVAAARAAAETEAAERIAALQGSERAEAKRQRQVDGLHRVCLVDWPADNAFHARACAGPLGRAQLELQQTRDDAELALAAARAEHTAQIEQFAEQCAARDANLRHLVGESLADECRRFERDAAAVRGRAEAQRLEAEGRLADAARMLEVARSEADALRTACNLSAAEAEESKRRCQRALGEAKALRRQLAAAVALGLRPAAPVAAPPLAGTVSTASSPVSIAVPAAYAPSVAPVGHGGPPLQFSRPITAITTTPPTSAAVTTTTDAAATPADVAATFCDSCALGGKRTGDAPPALSEQGASESARSANSKNDGASLGTPSLTVTTVMPGARHGGVDARDSSCATTGSTAGTDAEKTTEELEMEAGWMANNPAALVTPQVQQVAGAPADGSGDVDDARRALAVPYSTRGNDINGSGAPSDSLPGKAAPASAARAVRVSVLAQDAAIASSPLSAAPQDSRLGTPRQGSPHADVLPRAAQSPPGSASSSTASTVVPLTGFSRAVRPVMASLTTPAASDARLDASSPLSAALVGGGRTAPSRSSPPKPHASPRPLIVSPPPTPQPPPALATRASASAPIVTRQRQPAFVSSHSTTLSVGSAASSPASLGQPSQRAANSPAMLQCVPPEAVTSTPAAVTTVASGPTLSSRHLSAQPASAWAGAVPSAASPTDYNGTSSSTDGVPRIAPEDGNTTSSCGCTGAGWELASDDEEAAIFDAYTLQAQHYPLPAPAFVPSPGAPPTTASLTRAAEIFHESAEPPAASCSRSQVDGTQPTPLPSSVSVGTRSSSLAAAAARTRRATPSPVTPSPASTVPPAHTSLALTASPSPRSSAASILSVAGNAVAISTQQPRQPGSIAEGGGSLLDVCVAPISPVSARSAASAPPPCTTRDGVAPAAPHSLATPAPVAAAGGMTARLLAGMQTDDEFARAAPAEPPFLAPTTACPLPLQQQSRLQQREGMPPLPPGATSMDVLVAGPPPRRRAVAVPPLRLPHPGSPPPRPAAATDASNPTAADSERSPSPQPPRLLPPLSPHMVVHTPAPPASRPMPQTASAPQPTPALQHALVPPTKALLQTEPAHAPPSRPGELSSTEAVVLLRSLLASIAGGLGAERLGPGVTEGQPEVAPKSTVSASAVSSDAVRPETSAASGAAMAGRVDSKPAQYPAAAVDLLGASLSAAITALLRGPAPNPSTPQIPSAAAPSPPSLQQQKSPSPPAVPAQSPQQQLQAPVQPQFSSAGAPPPPRPARPAPSPSDDAAPQPPPARRAVLVMPPSPAQPAALWPSAGGSAEGDGEGDDLLVVEVSANETAATSTRGRSSPVRRFADDVALSGGDNEQPF